ncbi:Uncharacterised protein [Mycobacteroides abscessus subsp. abscessus]|nr:Uncharacterised protein [Mycobacteroides abscessus subsp. abscessus]
MFILSWMLLAAPHKLLMKLLYAALNKQVHN